MAAAAAGPAPAAVDDGDMPNEPDMQAFPLLRPDLIKSLPDFWLQRAQVQVRPLIESLSGVSAPAAARGHSSQAVVCALAETEPRAPLRPCV